jgi:hypothetical protein
MVDERVRTKPDSRTKEEKLLWTIFSSSTTDGEKAAAVERLKKVTGKDAGGLVEKHLETASDAGKGQSRDLLEELSRRILEVGNLEWEVSRLKSQVSTLTAELSSAKAARDYVMVERDRLVAELGHVKAERDRVVLKLMAERDRAIAQIQHIGVECHRAKAGLDRMKAEQRRAETEQRRASIPEIKCTAPGCSNVFRPRRRGHKTCSDTCRKALSRTTQAAIQ